MRKIIRDRAVVEDTWLHLDDEQPVPERGDVTVSWQRWQKEAELLRNRDGGRIGVRINGDVPVDHLSDELCRLPLLVLEFPAFKDGRCYSHARLLRCRHRYSGELRATGDVLRDQIGYMERVGINAFEVRQDRDVDDAMRAFDEFSVDYQGMGPGAFPLAARRAAAQG